MQRLAKQLTWQTLQRPLISSFVIALVLIVLVNINAFSSFQLSLTNVYYLDAPPSGAITLIALDNASFAAFGRNPTLWNRTIYAELVDRVAADGARVIVFDLIFTEPSEDDTLFAQALMNARASAARTRIVMASVGVNIPSRLTSDAYTSGLSYDTVLYAVPALDAASDYRGFVNAFPDTDSRVRRQASLVQVPDNVELSLSLATYLAYLRLPRAAVADVVVQQGETLTVTPARTLAIDSFGLWRQNFFTSAARAGENQFTVVSLLDVLEGRADPALFADRIVMVGILNSTGATDQAITPNSAVPMAGVEVQANAVESLLMNRALTEQSEASESMVVAGFAFASMLAYTAVGWRQKLLMMVLFVGAYIIFSFVQFAAVNTVNNLFYPLLALMLPFFASMGFDLTDEVTLRIRSEAQVHLLEELNRKAEAEKTLLAELNQKTEAERETLRQLNELKTRMIRMASHDLKNPLGRVFGYSELVMMDETLKVETLGFVRNIWQAGDEMNHLITELLDLEQLRTGVMNRELLSFSQLVRQVVTRHDPDFYRRGQHYHDQIAADEMMVDADARQMSQAVSNLIGNAIKYTPDKGTITVRVYEKEGMARLEIEDTGYGIPADAIPQLFTEFFRAKTQATQQIKGTGLGLSLVKQIAQAHAGRVWAESVEGQGSTFFMEIPLATPA